MLRKACEGTEEQTCIPSATPHFLNYLIMKTSGEGFTYYIDGERIKDFDTFEKKINKLEIKETIVKGLEVYAKTV